MNVDSKMQDDKIYDDQSLDQVKKDICTPSHVRRDSISNEEMQNKIEEMNLSKSRQEVDEESAININNILFKNIENKKTAQNLVQISNGHLDIDESEISKETKTEVVVVDKNKKFSDFEVINQDPYLKPFENKIRERYNAFYHLISEIEKYEGDFFGFCEGYNTLGLNVTEEGIHFREYAPAAKRMSIFGDFNYWNRNEFQCSRDQFGFWSIIIPRKEDGELPIKHNSKLKINLTLPNGKSEDRNPAWSRYLVQSEENLLYDTVFWYPEKKYEWEHVSPPKPRAFRIYEAHVGMSSLEPKISTYVEFADNVLPRIKKAGYNAVQLMAIMEHVYYASFGYHVTNFFAISSRSGTPEDLKYLIDKAHGMGLYVLIDLIHSHASSNVLDGINLFDGTDYLYFHGGEKGLHKQWDSRLFNYKNWETLRFLLSNCSWYLDEYHFDGFRFDGITSILYVNHGINYSFSGRYNEYFNENVDLDGEIYLMLANYLIHKKNPNAITIAEDVSGMPTLCRPVEEGGFGFDYRLNMSVPDKWIQLLKEYKDEQWNMGNLCFNLTNRRYNEKHVAYCESHDQSIVGDKTISMWLFDREIYYNMAVNKSPTIVIDRGMALHKMIRLITFSLGGEAYLNFMGNEFGHPEWVDFPRIGNNFSHHYCRRRWDLCDNKELRYQFLNDFDISMNNLDDVYGILTANHQYITLMHEKDKIIAFEKGDLLFIFNFHPYQSFEHYRIGTKWGSEHLIILDTDENRFDGKDRLRYGHSHYFPIIKEKWMNRANYIQLYLPSRTAIVLIAKENLSKYQQKEDDNSV